MRDKQDERPGGAKTTQTGNMGGDNAPRRKFEDLPAAAQRALKEAEERRRAKPEPEKQPTEVGGRGGKDPARYGDWEIDGRAVDF